LTSKFKEEKKKFPSSRERRRNQQYLVEEYFKSKDNEKIIEEFFNETLKEEDSLLKQTQLIESNNRSKKNRDIILEKEKIKNNIRTSLIKETYNTIVYMGLPLDISFKEEHSEKLKEKINESFNVFINSGICQLQETSILVPILENIDYELNLIDDFSNIKQEDINELVESLNEKNFDYIYPTCNILESHVIDAIGTEKAIALKKAAYLNEGFSEKQYSNNTIFRTILETNTNNLNEGFSSGLTDDSFAESVLDYTILESFNVLKLIDFKMSNYSNKLF